MSYHTAVALGIVTMDNSTVSSVSTKAPKQATKTPVFPPPSNGSMYSKEELKHMFPSLFSGNLGCLKDVKVHSDLDHVLDRNSDRCRFTYVWHLAKCS